MIKIDRKTHAPPILRFTWGSRSNFPGSHMNGRWFSQNRGNGFLCIVESVRQRFTLFSPSGVALRATLTVSLKEYKTLDQQVRDLGLQSPDHTQTHVIQRDDTLSRIASDTYDDPTQWRAIADANRLTDPLDLPPGRILDLPSLR
jgi:nucleoid-associated protein YgaU